MIKGNKYLLGLLICQCFLFQDIQGQAKSGLENYHFLGQGGVYNWMPVMHYESRKGFYSEIRYNYEELSTFSLFAGKKIKREGILSFSMTPMLGLSAGTFSGLSAALNTEAEWKNCFLSVQSQYSVSFSDYEQSFLFNWSELGFSLGESVFAGIATQFTMTGKAKQLEPGFLAGLEWGRLSMPVYLFNPFSSKDYFVIGLNFQYIIK